MATTTGSLTTATTVTLTLGSGDNRGLVTLSGTYGTVQGTIQGYDGSVWVNLAAVQTSNNSLLTSTLSPSDNSTVGYLCECSTFSKIRFNCSNIASGTVVVDIASGYFAAPLMVQPQLSASLSGPFTISSNSSNSLAVGANGTTNPVLQIDSSTGSVATGLKVTGAAAASGLALAVISSGTNENLTIDAKGSGTITLNGTGTGVVTIGSGLTMTDAKNIVVGSTTGSQIATATTQKLGFFGATPIVQPAASTDTSTGAAGSTTSVFLNTTFVGAGGTAAYTIGGVVTKLKALGLLAA